MRIFSFVDSQILHYRQDSMPLYFLKSFMDVLMLNLWSGSWKKIPGFRKSHFSAFTTKMHHLYDVDTYISCFVCIGVSDLEFEVIQTRYHSTTLFMRRG